MRLFRRRPSSPVREMLPWHDEGVAGDFKRAACAVMLEAVAEAEISTDQARALLDTHARHVLGYGGIEFAQRWHMGLLAEAAPGVASCLALLRYSRELDDLDLPDAPPEVLVRAARRPRRYVREGDG